MAAPFQALPVGIYFNPSAEECVRDFLRPWIAGVRPATDRVIIGVDIYSDRPAALLQGRAPGFSRGFEHKWFMLTQCVRICGGKNRGKARAKRDVATGGNWKVEQRSKGVAEPDDGEDDPPGGDRRRTNGFYLLLGGGAGKGTKKDGGVKTPWLMEEFTTAEDEAAAVDGWKGQRIIKVFCKLYVSPRATNDEKRDIFGEDGVPVDLHGHVKTVMAKLSHEYFDAVAENLNGDQGQGTAPPRALGHQQGQPAAPVLPRVPGHHHGHAVLPRGVPARPHQIQGSLGFQRGQATP
uniref:NAC domain-containing protein n=1 Tax=Setaria italica TaxID=4555 RepID=K3YBZ9_SETIT